MIATTIEQSKCLLELGLDAKTADMIYQSIEENGNGYWDLLPKSNSLNVGYPDDIPAWSLSALLKLIPPIDAHSYVILGTLDKGIHIQYPYVTKVCYQETEPVDAVYEMVVWLIEKGIIKTEK